MFKSSYNKGFSMTFQNGLTISVQWGVANYCERRSFHHTHADDMKNTTNESPNAEIAIWSEDGTTFDFGNDWVKGYISADEVAHWIYLTMSAIDLNHVGHMARMFHELMPPLDTNEFVIPDTYQRPIVDESRQVKSNITIPDNYNSHHCDDPNCNCEID